ncbi:MULTISPECIES: NUDIX domain-containing protein [unclassified Streptomyces]|uniref:NUDIX domain-containing protein n=1 Tax=unclassified Streptomyces TaxID=2593676 RepID=UPI001BE5E9F0|nr:MULTISPECIES: NUDIX domain-containing protein [unclassified Streptomyces]MBT2405373.1 NUDIX domain-containing protein [Streptomyces sp. ISL-21]MBT2454124.1 NUDIX domain-containing protein [Streptomyces sp. ISL-86]MBT2612224.1 NUDIX domain-containing protein [Streptomyces sp. ISL-87]
MTQKRSAGLLLFRQTGDGNASADGIEVLLGHMGGPFWERRDAGAWGIPKGEYGLDETPRDAARREFTEEIGLPPPDGPYLPLGEVRLVGGKLVTIWAVRADLDPALMVPGTFTMEWPQGSGRVEEFPELDRVAWFPPPVARTKLVTSQIPFLERLLGLLEG